ncbi:MAG TPA: uracil-DNA glycosylase family protein [Gemmatimonadaceae bacterium]|nr:uracil-DNA glycosylase family protein [Gemmatimonadaceae bacterium]
MAMTSALEKHCRALGACRQCGLADGVVPIVSRAEQPQAMLVGQAPGKVEAAGGNAFAGRAGKTLFRWLERAGVDEATFRRRVYIAAVTRCYPGASPSGRGDRVPSPDEQDRCSAWLDAELRLIRPKLLIPVGRLAITRFLPNLPLDQLIGRAHDVEHAHGRTLAIPLPHPSGASSWIHEANHPQLLARALELIGQELDRLGIATHDRSVA